jgi:hypothetical protein
MIREIRGSFFLATNFTNFTNKETFRFTLRDKNALVCVLGTRNIDYWPTHTNGHRLRRARDSGSERRCPCRKSRQSLKFPSAR